MLLNVDGLDKRWKNGVKSSFEGELGWHAAGDVEHYAPLIFRRVHSGIQGNIRELDLGRNIVNFASDDGYVNDDNIEISDQEVSINDRSKVKSKRLVYMSNKNLKDLLVNSFHRKWTKNKIVWPSRTGKMKS